MPREMRHESFSDSKEPTEEDREAHGEGGEHDDEEHDVIQPIVIRVHLQQRKLSSFFFGI